MGRLGGSLPVLHEAVPPGLIGLFSGRSRELAAQDVLDNANARGELVVLCLDEKSQIQALERHIAHLLDEELVGAQREGAVSVRLELERSPNPGHRRLAHARGPRESAGAPLQGFACDEFLPSEMFKRKNKFAGLVGLYMNPPDHARR